MKPTFLNEEGRVSEGTQRNGQSRDRKGAIASKHTEERILAGEESAVPHAPGKAEEILVKGRGSRGPGWEVGHRG